MKFVRAALFSFLISVVTFLPMFLIPADANSSAIANNASRTLSVNSGTFILYPTTSATGVNPGAPLTLLNTSSDQFFYLRNTGTIAIAKFTLTITTSPIQSFVISRCALNVAFTGVNTCASGTPTSVSIVSGVVTLAIPANSWYDIDFNPGKGTTPTVSVSTSSSQIRSPLTTNS